MKMRLQNKIQISKRIYLFYSSSNESCLRSRIFAFFDFFLDLKPSDSSPLFFGIIFWLSLASAVISSSSFQLCSRWSSSILFSDDFADSSVAKNTPVKCAICVPSRTHHLYVFLKPLVLPFQQRIRPIKCLLQLLFLMNCFQHFVLFYSVWVY